MKSIAGFRILSCKLNDERSIPVLTGVTIACLLVIPLLPESVIIAPATVLLLSANAFFSVRYLYRHGSISPLIVLLNCLQLLLFSLFHYQVYRILSPASYQAAADPLWHHWLELVGIHAFKAADIIDIMEEYGLWQPHIKNTGILSGLLLLMMNILLDLFLFSAMVKLAGRFFPDFGTTRHAVLRRILKRFCPPVLAGLFILFSIMLFGRFMADAYHVDPSNLVRWPLENLLRTIDIGDAFQIFGWQLHSMRESFPLSTLSVCFRLVLSFYLLDALGSLHLRLSKGKGCTIEELGDYFASGEASQSSRVIAAKALGRLGPEATNAAPQLLCCFDDPSPQIRRAGAEALVRIGSPAIDSLVPLLAHRKEEVRRSVMEVLAGIDPRWSRTPEARQSVILLLNGVLSPHVQSREAARSNLEKILPDWPQSSEASSFMPHFLTALSHHDEAVRLSAAEALECMENHADLSRFRLIRALSDPNGYVRSKAAAALNKLDPQWNRSEAAANLLPVFTRKLEGETSEAEAAADALALTGSPAVPFLLKCLEKGNKQAGRLAAQSLAAIGSPSVAGLISLLETDGPARAEASEALRRIGKRAILPLVKELFSCPASMADPIGKILTDIGPQALPVLNTALKKNLAAAPAGIIIALACFEKAAAPSVPYLMQLEDHPDVRSHVREAFSRIDPDGEFRRARRLR